MVGFELIDFRFDCELCYLVLLRFHLEGGFVFDFVFWFLSFLGFPGFLPFCVSWGSWGSVVSRFYVSALCGFCVLSFLIIVFQWVEVCLKLGVYSDGLV